MNTSIATERFRAALISSFAGVGLLLAMLGRLWDDGVHGGATYIRDRRAHGVWRGEERNPELSPNACGKAGLVMVLRWDWC